MQDLEFSFSRVLSRCSKLASQAWAGLLVLFFVWAFVDALIYTLDYRVLSQSHWLVSLLSFTYLTSPFFFSVAILLILRGEFETRVLMDALRLLPTVLMASILTTVAAFIGFFLLVVPALWVLAVTSIIFPLILDQKLSVLAAIEMSLSKCRPHVWKILGLFAVLLVVPLLAGAIPSLFQEDELYYTKQPWMAFEAAVSVAMSLAFSVLSVSIYLELIPRDERAGSDFIGE